MSSPRSYHHGDLSPALRTQALLFIREQGIAALSLRKLADSIGVSAPAIYHHYRNKEDLLRALALTGLERFNQEIYPLLLASPPNWQENYRRFAHAYLDFARQDPELYELMFGRTLWKSPGDDDYKQAARQTFRRYCEALLHLLPPLPQPIRLAQMGWATLHGLAHMLNDGLAFRPEDLQDIADYAVNWLALRL